MGVKKKKERKNWHARNVAFLRRVPLNKMTWTKFLFSIWTKLNVIAYT